MVYTSAKHLLGLINDLLDLSRIESGRMEVAITHVALLEVVTEVLQVGRSRARRSGGSKARGSACI
jgi:two-component system sensor histidine kinase/response regulator